MIRDVVADFFLFVSTFLGRVRSISQERFKGLNLREHTERGFPLPCGKVVFVRTREGRWMLCSAQPERPASESGLKYMSSDFQFVTVASPPSNLPLRALLCWRSAPTLAIQLVSVQGQIAISTFAFAALCPKRGGNENGEQGKREEGSKER